MLVLFSPGVELSVGLLGVLGVAFAHFAEVFILHAQLLDFILHHFYFLFVVAIHLHGQVSAPVNRVIASLHENYLLLQLLHLSFVLFHFFDGGLIHPLGVSFFFFVAVLGGNSRTHSLS